MVRIIGISAFYHDSAAALVEDGRIVPGRVQQVVVAAGRIEGVVVHNRTF